MTTIVRPRLNCHFNCVIKTSRKRPRPLLGITIWSFPSQVKDCDTYYDNSLIKVYLNVSFDNDFANSAKKLKEVAFLFFFNLFPAVLGSLRDKWNT